MGRKLLLLAWPRHVCMIAQRKAYNIQVAKSAYLVKSGFTLTTSIIYVGALLSCYSSNGRYIPRAIVFDFPEIRDDAVPTLLIYGKRELERDIP